MESRRSTRDWEMLSMLPNGSPIVSSLHSHTPHLSPPTPSLLSKEIAFLGYRIRSDRILDCFLDDADAAYCYPKNSLKTLLSTASCGILTASHRSFEVIPENAGINCDIRFVPSRLLRRSIGEGVNADQKSVRRCSTFLVPLISNSRNGSRLSTNSSPAPSESYLPRATLQQSRRAEIELLSKLENESNSTRIRNKSSISSSTFSVPVWISSRRFWAKSRRKAEKGECFVVPSSILSRQSCDPC